MFLLFSLAHKWQWIKRKFLYRGQPLCFEDFWQQALALPEETIDVIFQHAIDGTERQASKWDGLDRRGIGILVLITPLLVIAPFFAQNAVSFMVLTLLSVSGIFAAVTLGCVFLQIKAGTWMSAKQPPYMLREIDPDDSKLTVKRILLAGATYAYGCNEQAAFKKGMWLNFALVTAAIEWCFLIAAVLAHVAKI